LGPDPWVPDELGYALWVRVDATYHAQETEGDLQGPVEVTAYDSLAPTDLEVTDVNLHRGDKTELQLTVRNNGNNRSAPFWVYTEDNAASFQDPDVRSNNSHTGLDAGAEYTFRWQMFSDACELGCSLWGQVAGDDLNDTDPENNLLGPVPIVPLSPASDLVVESIDWSTNGQNIEYQVTVRNQDAYTAANKVGVEFYVDSDQDPGLVEGTYDLTIDTIAPGASETVTFSYDPYGHEGLDYTPDDACAQGCTSWARIDRWHVIPETDDTNNAASAEVTGAGIADIDVYNVLTTVSAGQVTYDISLRNLGTYATSEFYVEVYGNAATLPTDLSDDFIHVPGLAAGENTLVSLQVAQDCLSGCTSWVAADVEDAVLESNDANNVWGPAVVSP
jgi:hypothetical protein